MDQVVPVDNSREVLITGFNEYCSQILTSVGNTLGATPLAKLIQDLEKVLGYVKKYQSGSWEKHKIVNDLKDIITEIKTEYKLDKDRKGKGGIFSLFS